MYNSVMNVLYDKSRSDGKHALQAVADNQARRLAAAENRLLALAETSESESLPDDTEKFFTLVKRMMVF